MMMNFSYLLSIFLITTCLNVFSQTYEATYQFEINKTYYKKAIKKGIKEGKSSTLMKKAFSKYLDSKPAKAKLVFDTKNSYYYVIQHLESEQDNLKIDPIALFNGDNSKYYTIKGKDSVWVKIKNSSLDISEFLVKKKQKAVILKSKTKEIGQYTCYLATLNFSSKKEIKLWYAPDVPTGFNILDYEGLPGLLIKIESDLFNVNLLSLKEVEESKLEHLPTDIPKISSETYKEMLDKTNPFKN